MNGSQSPARHTILLVDDSPTVGAQVRRLLGKEGFDVVVEINPMFAPQAVVRHAPSIVLLDVEMRSLSGGRVAALIAAERSSRNMRVVFYSSLPDGELEALVEETGVDGYISKASAPTVLVAEIKALLAEME